MLLRVLLCAFVLSAASANLRLFRCCCVRVCFCVFVLVAVGKFPFGWVFYVLCCLVLRCDLLGCSAVFRAFVSYAVCFVLFCVSSLLFCCV